MSFKLTDFITVSNTGITTFGADGIFINRTGADAYLFFQKSGVNRGAIYGGDAADGNGLRFFLGNNSDPSLSIVSNGNVGIGTVSPSELLTLGGTANVQLSLISNDTTDGMSEIYFGDTASTNRGFISYDHDGDKMDIGTAASTKLTITSVGNVGIKATPTASSLNVKFNTGGTDAAESVIAANIGDDATLTSAGITIRNAGNRGNKGNASGSNLFKAEFNDATAMIINKNGDVGIGTSSPSGYFFSGGGMGIYGGTTRTTLSIISNTFSGLYFSKGDGTSTNAGANAYQGYIEYQHSSDSLQFATAQVERMRISSGGDVEINNLIKFVDATAGSAGTPQFKTLLSYQFSNVNSLSTIKGGNEASSTNGTYLQFFVNSSAAANTPLNILTLQSSFSNGTNAQFKSVKGSGENLNVKILDSNPNYAQGTGGGLLFQGIFQNNGNVAGGGAIQISKVNSSNGDYAYDMHFYTRPLNSSLTKSLTIASSGYIIQDTSSATSTYFQIRDRGTTLGYFGSADALLNAPTTNTQFAVRSEDDFAIATGGGTRRLVISSTGNVGIGGTSTSNKLYVYGSINGYLTYFYNDGNDANYGGIHLNGGANNGSGTTYYLRCDDGDATEVGGLRNNSGTFQLYDSSDRSLKENIEDTDIKGLDRINALKVRKFNWKKNGILNVAGFVAQEVENIIPEASSPMDSGLLSVSVTSMVPTLVKAIQEQQTIIESQKSLIDILTTRIEALED